jgi:hypothetical protein
MKRIQYFIVPVFGCVEPEPLIGPFNTFGKMLTFARKIYAKQREEDAIFYLRTEGNGVKPTVESFANLDMEEEGQLMTAKCIWKQDSVLRHIFEVEHEDKTYDVVIWFDSARGKFVDDEISFEGNELEGEGVEGDIRKSILDYLDANWDTLINK